MANADSGTPVRRINVYWNAEKTDGHRLVFYQRGGQSYVWDNHGGERKMEISKADLMYPTQTAQRIYGYRAVSAVWARTHRMESRVPRNKRKPPEE